PLTSNFIPKPRGAPGGRRSPAPSYAGPRRVRGALPTAESVPRGAPQGGRRSPAPSYAGPRRVRGALPTAESVPGAPTKSPRASIDEAVQRRAERDPANVGGRPKAARSGTGQTPNVALLWQSSRCDGSPA